MMKIDKFLYLSISIFLMFGSCKMEQPVNPLSLPAFGEKGVNVVIEIPSGTNHKIEVNKSTGAFENDQLDGKDLATMDLFLLQ